MTTVRELNETKQYLEKVLKQFKQLESLLIGKKKTIKIQALKQIINLVLQRVSAKVDLCQVGANDKSIFIANATIQKGIYEPILDFLLKEIE